MTATGGRAFSPPRKSASAAILLLLALLAGCNAPRPAPASPAITQPAPATKPAARSAPKPIFIDVAAINYPALLPAPAQPGSAFARAEGDILLGVRSLADDAAKQRMRRDEHMTLFTFADVLGEGFTAPAYPRTARLFKKIDNDIYAAVVPAKNSFDRPRPPTQDSRVEPLIPNSGSGSYPSGHATTATVWSRILADLAPEQKDALRERARVVCVDRIIAGAHYPSDVAAGVALGEAIADALLRSDAFLQELDAVRAAEWD